MRVRAAMALAAALVLPLGAAFGQSAQTAAPSAAATPGMPGNQSATQGMQTAASREMMDAMAKMNKTMGDAVMTGDPDKDFVRMMMPHHQGAIDMAEVELKYGKDRAMRKMATGIVAAQKKEIGEMQRWLAKHP